MAAEPLPGPSTVPSYDGDNGEKLDIDSHLWREEGFCKAGEKTRQGHYHTDNEPAYFGYQHR